ncbi:anhydro-N-acetylmuramic acid kinase [Streptomyces carpaticus]|uniref:Anhydro-N-acetylmuramic acid kinase n=1 Tax=Streptomyces carpaticus TaxID=285558 RepID=A0ABV4ZPZ6_9ACTN
MTAMDPARPQTVLGMLSGTSHDAVDVAAAHLRFTDPHTLALRPLGLHSEPFPTALRDRIAAALPPARVDLAQVCRLDTELGQFFGAVAARADTALTGGRADLLASHGQTVYHWVDDGRARGTLQLGSAAWIARATGLPVLSDLRTADIARGGQGAPLVSLLDALWLLGDGTRRGALNLGGIANITVPGPDTAPQDVLAYDLGPAGALIDAAVTAASRGAERMDTDGARAARGRADAALLRRLLAEPYYRLPPPKSTGKELFHPGYLDTVLRPGDPTGDDLVATLTELTAHLVGTACRTHRLTELVVSGGGVRNPVLLDRVRAAAAPARVVTSTAHGLPAQAKEAYLFALLGYLSAHGLPGTLPSATGATAPAVLGSWTPGAGPLRLPPPHPGAPRRLIIEQP